jgi:Immunoglobulin domain
VVGPYRGKLDNAGDDIELYKPDAPQPAPDAGFVPYILVDRVNYQDSAPWPAGAVDGGGLSLQRRNSAQYGNDPVNWVASAPTPGSANGPGVVAPPTINQSPQNLTVTEDSSATFTIGVIGQGPLSYQWRFNGISIPEATNTTLALDFAQLEHTGNYDVFVSNPGGSAFSAAASLIVTAPPVLLEAPQNQVGRPGTNATFRVVVRGSQPISYQWRFKGVTIPGATSATLTVTNAQLESSGEYSVAFLNALGSGGASATLTILVAPVFVQQPQSQTAVVGDNVTFTVSGFGTTPMGFRWRRTGTTITNGIIVSTPSSSSLTLANVQPSNAAIYTVVITNAANPSPGILSSNAVLTVLTDTDGDHMPDVWETANGTDPNTKDGDGDNDGDGMTNLQEFIAGTDPRNPQSYLRVDQLSVTGGATLRFQAVSNKTYTVQYNLTLANNGWLKLADVAARPTNRVETVPDLTATNSNRYYRLVTPQQP